MVEVVDSKEVDLYKYESTKSQLVLGDRERINRFIEERDKLVKKRDGYLKQGKNRSNSPIIIHLALNCLEEHGLSTAFVQTKLPVNDSAEACRGGE
ncbi:hypothetical protein [Candidatus Methanoperedens nitratireducens]|uniref:Uncharacterized protein n=1 Tax=Candidatus Methanoperedens nitratireducens TaxID=1392998 RepID=A0A284VNL5_9EURY|nr:hypothetical protein [Candidatus Methanoperedens nitroreducens]SNQ60871.1 hypothetical protein MNV_2060013 [Candidatus Methanoperedens nitroreducens]